MYLHGELCDLTVKVSSKSHGDVEGVFPEQEFRTHRVALATVSPVLRRMLLSSFKEGQKNQIVLYDIDPGIFAKVVDFIYLGNVHVSSVDEMFEIGKVSDRLDIAVLSDSILSIASSKISDDNCWSILKGSRVCGLSCIADCTMMYILENFERVVGHAGFLAADEEMLSVILASDDLVCQSEETIYEILLSWIEHVNKGQKEGDENIKGIQLLQHVRFPLMDGEYLALEINQKTSFISHQSLLKALITEAAMWQLVPTKSKHMYRLQTLSESVLLPRKKSWLMKGSRIRHVLQGHCEEVQALKMYKNKLISGSVDTTIRVWNAWNCSCEHQLRRHRGAVCALEVASSLLFSGSVDRTICVWSTEDWTCLHTLTGHLKSVFALKFIGEQLFSGSDDGEIKIWDAKIFDIGDVEVEIKPVQTLSIHKKAVCALEANSTHGGCENGFGWALTP
eukprot:768810-Hanusia_phi.AAC.11